MRQVRHSEQQGLQFKLDRIEPLGRGVELVLDARHLRHGGGGFVVLAFALEHADLFAGGVALRLQRLGAHLDGFALGLQRGERFNVQKRLRAFAGFQAGDGAGEVFAEQVDI